MDSKQKKICGGNSGCCKKNDFQNDTLKLDTTGSHSPSPIIDIKIEIDIKTGIETFTVSIQKLDNSVIIKIVEADLKLLLYKIEQVLKKSR